MKYLFTIFIIPIIFNFTLSQTDYYETHDKPTIAQIDSNLFLLEKYSITNILKEEDILRIYNIEKSIGRGVWKGRPEEKMPMFSYYSDSALGFKCLRYIQQNISHFRMVDDGFKGENNFMEPSKYWDSVAQQLYPNSFVANEISFDIEFREMVRKYTFNEYVAGKTCEQHCRDEFQSDTSYYLMYYGRDLINKWSQECAELRAQFEMERTKLLEKYGNTPFTKKLRDIDVTTIVIDLTVC